jgi:hypothetical protein
MAEFVLDRRRALKALRSTAARVAALNTVAVAGDLYGAGAEAVARQAFEDRGIL